jgi:hypothetical protein
MRTDATGVAIISQTMKWNEICGFSPKSPAMFYFIIKMDAHIQLLTLIGTMTGLIGCQ